jgi:hypothetical protein
VSPGGFVLSLYLGLMPLAPFIEHRPKIVAPALCGDVSDVNGAPIKNASVAAMWADFGTSTKTNELGQWSFGAGTGPHWMEIEAEGFETFIFDYVDQAEPHDSGGDKPAFTLPPKNAKCAVPIHVRLAPKGSSAGSVSLDTNTNSTTRKKSQ